MKRVLIIAGSCLTILLVMIFATDPRTVPAFVLVLPFILGFILCWLGVRAILRQRGWNRRRSDRIGALIAAMPIVLLVMQSIGQLTPRDLVIMVTIFLLGYFYVVRMTSPAD